MKSYEFLIDVNELREHLADPGWRVVDCRFNLLKPGKGRADYLEGHIPGAVYAHLDDDLAGPVNQLSGRHPLPDPELLALTLGGYGIDNATQVVVYDDAGGAIAARLWWLLNWLGHRNVALLDGGIVAWKKFEAVTDVVPDISPTKFVPQPYGESVISTDALVATLQDPAPTTVVDARDGARFAGEVEPIDSIAGHIPGAVNFPFADSLAENGCWLDPSTLEARWNDVLGPERDAAWIAMCGSGVTACHLAISARLAGYRAPVLYAGSWSEWIRDSARPVVGGAG